MRTLTVTAIALIVGLLAGFVLSEVIGIIGFLLFDRFVGIRFLPILLALALAVTAPIVDRRVRHRSR